MYVVLNLGCGHDIKKSLPPNNHMVNVDVVNLPGVDIVHDLNSFPYPFDDSSIDRILMNNILEHLDNPIAVLQECWRIMLKNAECRIRVVYWNHKYSYSDPQHKHAFSEKYFDFFVKGRNPHYMKNHFDKVKIDWIFDKKAKKQFGKDPEILLTVGYWTCNVIQGMEVTLIK